MNGMTIAGSHRRLGVRIAAIALLTALVPVLLPTPSSAFGTLRVKMTNASAPVTLAGRSFEIRLEVGTTCSPVMGAHFGQCSNIAISVTYWNTTGLPTTVNDSLSWLGGVSVIHVPADAVRPQALHFRATARQTWSPVECGPVNAPRCVKQSASAAESGRTIVLDIL